jgi:hypothetical protein
MFNLTIEIDENENDTEKASSLDQLETNEYDEYNSYNDFFSLYMNKCSRPTMQDRVQFCTFYQFCLY